MIRRNGLAIAMTVLLIGAVVSPAQAANKSGAACKTTNAKATIGGKQYTCTKNPIVVNARNTWVVADCLASNAAFRKSNTQLSDEKINLFSFRTTLVSLHHPSLFSNQYSTMY
jgi:hypothetical protein